MYAAEQFFPMLPQAAKLFTAAARCCIVVNETFRAARIDQVLPYFFIHGIHLLRPCFLYTLILPRFL